jgi:ribosomal protein L36
MSPGHQSVRFDDGCAKYGGEGRSRPSRCDHAKLIRTQGRLYTLDEFDEKKRKKAGLPSLVTKIEEVVHLLESES